MMMLDRHWIPITILVCDDDERDRRVAKRMFEEGRIANDVRFVEHGDALLDYLNQREAFAGETGAAPRPGLILLDVDMPLMDGRETLRRIRHDAAFAAIPVILLIAPGDATEVSSVDRTDTPRSILKPITFARLVDAMKLAGSFWFDIMELAPAPR